MLAQVDMLMDILATVLVLASQTLLFSLHFVDQFHAGSLHVFQEDFGTNVCFAVHFFYLGQQTGPTGVALLLT